MSVHNAAAGTFTIAARAAVPSSAVSAGADSFCQAFFEVFSFFAWDLDRVLLVYFDTTLPEVYLPVLPQESAACSWTRVLGLVLAPVTGFSFEFLPATGGKAAGGMAGGGDGASWGASWREPQDLLFLKNYLLRSSAFEIEGPRGKWVFAQLPAAWRLQQQDKVQPVTKPSGPAQIVPDQAAAETGQILTGSDGGA